MDKNITTEPVSADEFGKQSIWRFIHRPGVVRLDNVRGQANRISRMVSNKTPLLDHIQRYISGDSSAMYAKRQLMTYAHPVTAKNIQTGTDIQNSVTVKTQPASQVISASSLSGNRIQRSVSDSSITSSTVTNPGAQTNATKPHELIRTKTNQDKQQTNTGVLDNIKISLPDTNTTISEPIIRRHLKTPMIMQKEAINHGLISRATDIGNSEGSNLIRLSNTLASNYPAPVSVSAITNPAGIEPSTSVPDMVIQRRKEVLNTVKNSATKIGSPQNMGSEIIQRHEGMNVTIPLITRKKDSQPDSSSVLMTTATPLLQKKGSDSYSVALQHSSAMLDTDDNRSGHAADLQLGAEKTGVQQKAKPSIQLSALPIAEPNRNQSFQHVTAVKNKPSNTVSLQEYAGLNQHVQFNQSTPSQSVVNPTSTSIGQMVFRKPAANVLPLNGEIQSAGNNSNSYTNNIEMPVAATIKRPSEENIISRAVDAGTDASNVSSSTSSPQAKQSDAGAPSVTDELIDKIFSRLLRRMAVESERRGWRP